MAIYNLSQNQAEQLNLRDSANAVGVNKQGVNKQEYIQNVIANLPNRFKNTNSETDSDNQRTLAGDAKNQQEQKNQSQQVLNEVNIISQEKAEEIYQNIFDSQISGIKKSQEMISSKLAEINEQIKLSGNSGSFAFKAQGNFTRSANDQSLSNSELQQQKQMLEQLMVESQQKILKLTTEKQNEQFKQQIIDALRMSEEIQSYNEYDEKRRVMYLKQIDASRNNLSNLFGQAGVEFSSTQQNVQDQQGNQSSVEVVEINDPQPKYANQVAQITNSNQGAQIANQGLTNTQSVQGLWTKRVLEERVNAKQLSVQEGGAFQALVASKDGSRAGSRGIAVS